MYLALYRKYRPQTFDEVIGQDHIIQTLKNQIISDKIGHAYLFCGSRGTGKTSTAKIFARAINCENPQKGSPCGKCDVCKALSGNNIDILEIDAASNNGVDEIRDLREKVKYPPVNGKYKVYIVDEVHMLSPSAFNALLKTLEEPPSYAVFILATTEVHKLPATILSRCLRFDFQLVSLAGLCGILRDTFKKEGITAEKEAIEVIARAGEGSVRDTLSIADRCISYSGANLTYKSAMEILGTTDKEHLCEIANMILAGNLGGCLKELDKVLASGKTPLVLSKDLIAYFRDLLVISTLKKEAKTMVVATEEMFARMEKQSEDVNYDRIIATIFSLSEVEAELRYSVSPRLVLETAIVRTLESVSLEARVERLEKMLAEGGQIAKGALLENKNAQTPVSSKADIIAPKNNENENAIGGELLGKLLAYLREHKDMSLLSCIRQVKKVDVKNKTAVFYVEDKITLDVVLRDKYRPILDSFFDNLGLTYVFKVEEKKTSGGDIDALSSALNGNLKIKE